MRTRITLYIHMAQLANAGQCQLAHGHGIMQCLHSSTTAKYEYHYKGHEPYIQLLHAVYARFDTPSFLLYTLAYTHLILLGYIF